MGKKYIQIKENEYLLGSKIDKTIIFYKKKILKLKVILHISRRQGSRHKVHTLYITMRYKTWQHSYFE